MKSILTPVFLAAALFAVACSGGQSVDVARPVDLVPPSANMMALVKVDKLLGETEIASLYNDAPKEEDSPQTFEELLDKAQGKAGMDLRQMKDMVMFGDTSRDDEYMGVVARGSFDREKLLASIAENMDSTPVDRDYKGFQVYLGQGEDEDTALSVLNSETLVMGLPEAVYSVIDVQVGDLQPLSGDVRDTFDRLGDPMFRMAVAVPPDATDDLGQEELGSMPISMDGLSDLRVVGVMADKNGETMSFLAKLGFTSNASANEVKNMVQGLVSLMGAFGQDPDLATLLNKVQFTVTDNELDIDFQAEMPELKVLLDNLGSEF